MNQTNPMVTVLMSVFNGEQYLREAIDSILNQTFTDFEFIIIDDGSTDGTLDIIRGYTDPRIMLRIYRKNVGLYISLNSGLDISRGKYVARMDADDISMPDRLAKQVAFLESNPEIGVCGTWYKVFGIFNIDCFSLPTDYETIKANLFFGNSIGHPTVMMRKASLNNYGLRYNSTYLHAADYELWVECSLRFSVVNIPEVLLHYRVSPTSIGQVYNNSQSKTVMDVQKNNLKRLGIIDVDETTMKLHWNITNNDGDFSNKDFVMRAYTWLHRIQTANQEKQLYPEPYFSDVLAKKWQEICRLAQQYDASWESKNKKLNRPKVTVLMPVYNCMQYLREAIESILNQTFTDFEFLIIDDGSIDKSVEIIKSYNDSRIRLEENGQNLGLITTLNKGLDLAKGEFIARMDADDISMPERLAKQVALMDHYQEIGICGTWYKIFGRINCECFTRPTDYKAIQADLFMNNSLGHPTVMMRMDLLDKFGLRYDSAHVHAEDYGLWVKCSVLFPIVNIPEVLLHYRVPVNSIGQTYSEKQKQTVQQIHKNNLEKLGMTDLNEEILQLHQHIVYHDGDFSSKDFIMKSFAWLRWIHAANQEKQCYPEPQFSRLLNDKWREFCRRAQGLDPSFALVRNSLLEHESGN